MISQSDEPTQPKELLWVSGIKKSLLTMPEVVHKTFGKALEKAQWGLKHKDAKPLKGFGGAGVLEVVEFDNGGTYRAVYTVKFAEVVYVLHVFQKKSKSGSKTPSEELDKIRRRLRDAEVNYAEWIAKRYRANEEPAD